MIINCVLSLYCRDWVGLGFSDRGDLQGADMCLLWQVDIRGVIVLFSLVWYGIDRDNMGQDVLIILNQLDYLNIGQFLKKTSLVF